MINLKYTIITIIGSITVSGCSAFSDARPQIITYPDSLFECPDRPDPNFIVTDSDLAVYITKQDGVIRVCKEKLRSAGELIRKKVSN